MATIYNAVVFLPTDEQHRSEFSKTAPNIRFAYTDMSHVTDEEIASADIIIGNPPTGLLSKASNLKWLQLNSAGSDTYSPSGVLPENVILTNASGAYGLTISEHMIGMLMMLFKNLHYYRDNQFAGKWEGRESTTRTIQGTKALILGAGNIGSEFAKRVKALGARTIGVRRNPGDLPEYFDEMHLTDELDSLLPDADIVALSLPQNAETYHIIDRRRFALMKNDSVILNIGRGTAIDTEALCDALENGKLRGCGIDVTDPEPLPPEHRLWRIPSAIVTPHCSGGIQLKETIEFIYSLTNSNLKNFLEQKPMINFVDRKTGYRTR